MKELLMKILKNGLAILLIIAVGYIITLRECRHEMPCPPEGKVLVDKVVWDSVMAMANKPPEIHIDTVTIPGPPVTPPSTPNPDPVPDPVEPEINHYNDSLINNEIHVYYSFQVKGLLLDRSWKYVPIVKEITVLKTIYVPQIVEKPVPISKRGLYLYGTAGGNTSAFLFGGGADYITKKDTQIGYMYQRFGDQNIHSVKVGMKLKFK